MNTTTELKRLTITLVENYLRGDRETVVDMILDADQADQLQVIAMMLVDMAAGQIRAHHGRDAERRLAALRTHINGLRVGG